MHRLPVYILLLLVICLSAGCSDDDMDTEEMVDTEGPEFSRVVWIDNPGIDNDPAGGILDGSNHIISIQSGFHLLVRVDDQNTIDEGEIYFTINNDPEIREVLFSPELIINSTQSGVSFVHRVDRVWLGSDDWYELQPGDTYQFHARFTDEFGNESAMAWTADIVD